MSQAVPTQAAPTAPSGADPVSRRLTSAGAWICLLVIVAGANVTTTKSGDAIPTWPWGWLGDTAAHNIELTHRYVAALLIVTTAVAAWRTGSAALRRVAWAVFALVIVQAVLGGIRVLVGAADEADTSLPWLKVVHATLGQSIYPLAVAAAALASDWWATTKERPLDDTGLSMMRTAGFALLTMFLQIVLGALGRHDLLPREVHAFFALIPLVLSARLVLVAAEVPRDVELFRGPAAAVGFLTALQLALGVAAYIVTSEQDDPLKRDLSQIVVLNGHVGVSAAVTGLAVVMGLRAWRLWGPPTDERVAAARASQEPAA